jgi:hypothetical protein
MGGKATMIMPFTASDKDGPASSSRRRALADCAGLAATACFAPWNRCAAAAGTPKGELFAFAAPGGRDLVFALALAPGSFGQSGRDPLTVRLYAGTASWTVGPFAFRDTYDVFSDGSHLFSGQVPGTGSNGDKTMVRLIAIATPAARMPPGTLEVWAQLIGADGARWRIGNPVLAQILADDPRLSRCYPDVDRQTLSAAIGRRLSMGAATRIGGEGRARAKRLTALLLPDTLRFDPASPSGFTFAAMNGRRIEDAIDPIVRTLLAGAPRSGGSTGRYHASGLFPYFARADAA